MKILINIDVPDLPRAIEFYQAALGLKLSRTLDDDVAELSGGGTAIFLLQKQEHSTATKMHPTLRHYSRHWTPVHLDFVVDDLAAAAQRAEAAGAVRKAAALNGDAQNASRSPTRSATDFVLSNLLTAPIRNDQTQQAQYLIRRKIRLKPSRIEVYDFSSY